MRVLFSILSVTVFLSCSVSSQVNKPKRSFYGDYNPTADNETEKFSAEISYKGEQETNLEIDTIPSKLPLVEMTFKNTTDCVVVIGFPFNWHEEFIKKPVYFRFDQLVSKNHWAELFYPSKSDSLEGFVRSSQYVFLKPKESLSFEAFVFKSNLNDESNKAAEFSLWFKYSTMQRAKKMTTTEIQEFKTYRTKPISLNN
jgi:hypothetical protein